ncbi:hypothetical protein L1987_16623 [Smallanthus sonchifolius]|uniref:Uncharacterized protein n=1 Tax=Smallanthus sonchifolius TaxID=185202 RepID=A0ACB9IX42_9ASTR|nr:hypothetical protein L1987_16623 [Smallanthus sonchifolius]
MPRKKDQPPSALPTRRSTRGVPKSTSPFVGDESETLVLPNVGPGDSSGGNASSPQPPCIKPNKDVCDVNMEALSIPSVSMRSDDPEHVLGSIQKDGSRLHSPAATENALVGKPGCAGSGMSDSVSPGLLGVNSLSEGNDSSYVKDSGEKGYIGTPGSASPGTSVGSGSGGRTGG